MTSRLKCLVIDNMHESLFPMLTDIGWGYDYQPTITRDGVRSILHGYDGIIVRSKTIIDKDLLGDDPTIKFVGRAGAGLDILDLVYLASKGIYVLHASEGNRDAVGEFAVGGLLSLMRNIPRADQQVKEMIWNREMNRGEEIMGKTVGIIGYGNMGHAFAKRLRGFECTVLAFDKYRVSYEDSACKASEMTRVFEESDIVSLHIPLTPETRGMVNKEYLKSFKKRIILINTARGEIVSLADLAWCMENGNVRGAVLDVLENEKLDKLTGDQQQALNSLRKRTDVIFSPHIAGWTYESHIKINVALIHKIRALPLK
ncbi:MAG: NAD(P)-dependent oxidoreductase [Chryseolinea sp.]